MTHKQWIKLTSEEQLIAVALAAGWKDVRVHVGAVSGYPNDRNIMGIPPEKTGLRTNHGMRDDVPDYTGDLDAIQDVLRAQDNLGFWLGFVAHLRVIVLGAAADGKKQQEQNGAAAQFKLITATAAQRAEAFMLAKE